MDNVGKVLMLVENLPIPLDPRVWMEATTLRDSGFQISIICPKGPVTFFGSCCPKQASNPVVRIKGLCLIRH